MTTQVEAVGLQKTDLHTGQTRELIDGGDKVDGEVTLDNCGFEFTSEKFRLVRRQYQVTDEASGNGEISTEVVGYDTAVHARLALDEWFTSASTCPKTPVDSGVQGVPPLTYTVIDNRRDVAMVPVKPNVVTSETASAGSQGTERLMAFMQQRGQVLAIVYLDTSKPFTLAERSQAVALAGLVGKRLASQP